MIIGGGPAGMKAAAIAAQRGHHAILYEAERRLGGQALLAQMLPGRAEFGGLITNLERELELAGVQIHRNTRVDPAMVSAAAPDVVLVATGAKPYWPPFPREDGLQIVDAWAVLLGQATVGQSVVVIDWRASSKGADLRPSVAVLDADGAYKRLASGGEARYPLPVGAILSVGDGDEAKLGDTVEVHYTGWLKDGKKFDSSVDRKQPFTFRIGGKVIAGWNEGVQGMKVGGKRKLIIPPDLAYGKKGAGDDIPPDAELTFEVELLKIK